MFKIVYKRVFETLKASKLLCAFRIPLLGTGFKVWFTILGVIITGLAVVVLLKGECLKFSNIQVEIKAKIV